MPRGIEAATKSEDFPSISAFPDDLIEQLEKTHGSKLRDVGGIDVESVTVKIAKEARTYKLAQ